jgi:hypothetical protein
MHRVRRKNVSIRQATASAVMRAEMEGKAMRIPVVLSIVLPCVAAVPGCSRPCRRASDGRHAADLRAKLSRTPVAESADGPKRQRSDNLFNSLWIPTWNESARVVAATRDFGTEATTFSLIHARLSAANTREASHTLQIMTRWVSIMKKINHQARQQICCEPQSKFFPDCALILIGWILERIPVI